MNDIYSTLSGDLPVGCGCPACMSGDSGNPSPAYEAYDGYTSAAPTTYGTTEQMVDQLVNGYWESVGSHSRQWDYDTVKYNISSEFSSAQKASFRMAFAMWSDVADISFQEVSSGQHITIVEGDDNSAWSGGGSWNSSTGNLFTNTLSVDTNSSHHSWDDITTLGGYGVQTLLHEIGHSLGLGHAGDYNGSVNYNTDVDYLNDNRQYTLMSYNNANLLGTDHWGQDSAWNYAATPLLYDIMAMQQIYGANMTTRSGDTVYGFNSTAGRDQYNLSLSDAPFAIWDGGGTDTLDLSGYSTAQTIKLTSGEFTSAGYMTNNIVIAYGATIENAIGGSGNDTFYGNTANNVLSGNAGNDTFYTDNGNDTINGGDGTDLISYTTNIANFLIQIASATQAIITDVVGSLGVDTVNYVENFRFNGTTYSWAELAAFDATAERMESKFLWSGGQNTRVSFDFGDTTYTAAQLGYSGQSGDMLRINYSVTSYTITILNVNAPPTIRTEGSAEDDTIIITGAHNGLSTTVYGGSGNDTITITATNSTNKLYGDAGDDTINGGSGIDTIYGGADNDTINANAGTDILYGNSGNDTINGGAGNDRLEGGDGVDTLNGDDDNDNLYGDAGNDTLNGGAGNDRLYGGAGDDAVNGGDGSDYLYGLEDSDTLNGGLGIDYLYGGDGTDTIYGGSDGDYLYGDAGNDILYGDAGLDLILGGDGTDTIYGGADNDRLYGEGGADTLNGDAGNDFLYGQLGADTLNGGDGNDTLYGLEENDLLNGGIGNDILYGGAATDTLIGGVGNDILFGEAGADIFGFTDTSTDQIKDFTLSGVNADKINITDLLSGYTYGVSDISQFVFVNRQSSNKTDFYVDTNGGANSWVKVVAIFGSDFSGVTAQDMLDDGILITNQSLV